MASDYECSAEEIHRAFCDEKYWLARLADSGADDARLDSFRVGQDGGIDVVTTQVLRASRLPGIIHQFHHGDLEIRRAETWTGMADGASEASVASSIVGAPVSLNGDAELRRSQRWSRLLFRATVEVRIPLVGGKLEKFIGNQLAQLLESEQRFTTVWIGENR